MKTYKSCPTCGAILNIDSAYNGDIVCPKCKQHTHSFNLKELPSITVTCPECKARLVSYNINDNATIRCSKCKHAAPLADFRAGVKVQQPEPIVVNRVVESNLEYDKTMPNQGFDTSKTEINLFDGGTEPIGQSRPRAYCLRLLNDVDRSWNPLGQREFELKDGEHIIGKDSVGSSATIKLPTMDRFLSRNHFKIAVKYNAAKARYEHHLSDYNSKNGTKLKSKGGDWMVVRPGDILELSEGDIIEVGHTQLEVVYKMPK